jgi:formylglycine-generating enzyme required for sulfatase activity
MPVDRFPTARDFALALTTPTPIPSAAATGAAAAPERTRTRPRIRARVAVPVALGAAVLAFGGIRFFQHRADVRWATTVALPEIESLIEQNDVWRNLAEPYRLAVEAEGVLGDDPRLAEVFRQVSKTIGVRTDPPGASVYMKEYERPDDEWTLLGVTPLEAVRVPIGIFRWKVEKPGFETVLAAASTWNVGGTDDLLAPYDFARTLDAEESLPPRMVRVPATETPVGLLGDFFIGRYEVTNREYKAFVDAGGYRNPAYWSHPFEEDGRVLTRDEAMGRFVDQSGLPGPAAWLGGDYPEGEGDYPVSGVSWYEAAAYAEHAGMVLPTVEHWNVARGAYTPMLQWPQLGGFGVLAPFTNFGGAGPVAVGSLPSVTAYGAYDMPGNVREWCWNAMARGRVTRGGSWEDNTYDFAAVRQVPPMDRSRRNGFRLAHYLDEAAVPAAAFELRSARAQPEGAPPRVPDEVFAVYREQYAYDPTPLNARVDHSVEREDGWVHETVSFDAAYGDERVIGHLFLPTNASPPYQTVVYFPGSASTWMSSSEDIEAYYEFTMFLSFLVRNGRAVLYPVYEGTFERSDPALAMLHGGDDSYAYTELVTHVVKDLRRSVDYLQSREDIDGDRLAFYGMSWGAAVGPIITAVEDRLAASVLIAGGLDWAGRPEVRQVNYVPYVTLPTLILNGRYDAYAPPETASRPLLEHLGAADEDKQLILYDTDHIPPRTEYIRETLAWLDRYLGPVGR